MYPNACLSLVAYLVSQYEDLAGVKDTKVVMGRVHWMPRVPVWTDSRVPIRVPDVPESLLSPLQKAVGTPNIDPAKVRFYLGTPEEWAYVDWTLGEVFLPR
jgi:hypothetical protein